MTGLQFGLLVSSAAAKSPVVDEPSHLMRSYIVWKTGDLWFQEQHPPLLTRLALPTLLLLDQRPELPEPVDRADLWLWRKVLPAFPYHPDVLMFPARLELNFLAVLASLLICRWAWRRLGRASGLMAMFWLTFSPNWLAHAGLVTTDWLGASLFLVALLAFHESLHRPSRRTTAFAGLAQGLALGAKASAMLLVPATVLVAVAHGLGLRDEPADWPGTARQAIARLWRSVRPAAWALAVGLLVLWGLYGFELAPWWTGGPPLPLKTHFTRVLWDIYQHSQEGHAAYLLGQGSTDGWWYYFPVALIVKTPLPTLLGAALGVAVLVRRRRWATLFLLTAPSGLWMAAAMNFSLNIGFRHILPILPLLVLMAAAAWQELPWPPWRSWRGAGLLILALWLAISTLRIAPHFLAYFNELAGGPRNGRFWLSDSNLDWGQDIKALGSYLDRHPADKVYFSLFTAVDPAVYGVDVAHSFPPNLDPNDPNFTPFNPPPGLYILSANHLTGQGLYVYFQTYPLEWFSHRQPCDSIGYSLLVYCVQPDPSPPQWLAICASPAPIVAAEEALHLLGRPDLGTFNVDCHADWTTPAPGPGWILLPPDARMPDSLAEHLAVDFVHKTFAGEPVFTLFRYRP